jgi:hypothetical protein
MGRRSEGASSSRKSRAPWARRADVCVLRCALRKRGVAARNGRRLDHAPSVPSISHASFPRARLFPHLSSRSPTPACSSLPFVTGLPLSPR